MARRLDSKWLRERFLDHFQDAVAEGVENTSYDLEGTLLRSNMLDLGDLLSLKLRNAGHTFIRNVMAEWLSQHIKFEPEKRLVAWSRDAFEFFRLNQGNSDFINLFSKSLNYDVVLRDLLSLVNDTREFRTIFESYAAVDLTDRITPSFDEGVLDLSLAIADEALGAALGMLGRELWGLRSKPAQRSRAAYPILQQIEQSSSFRNQKGMIHFEVASGRLSLRPENGKATKVNYKALLDRALGRIEASHHLEGISNRDPNLSALMKEYIATYREAINGDDILILFAIGQDIDARVVHNQKFAPEDERIDGDALGVILSFISAHGLYIEGFDVIRQAAEDMDRINEHYSRLNPDAKPLPWSLLHSLAYTQQLFEPKTDEVMKKLAGSFQQPVEPTKALTSLGIGALRGSFRAMAGSVLERFYKGSLDLGGLVTKETLKDIVGEVVKSPGFQHQVGQFFLAHTVQIAGLAESMPYYFSWLRPFLDLLREL